MKALTISITGLVALAIFVAALAPGNTAGVVLALGSPFTLFANVMAMEQPRAADTPAAPAHSALLVDWM